MENIIEHEGKKYRDVPDDGTMTDPCRGCCFNRKDGKLVCVCPIDTGDTFDCVARDCHFELVEETNQKE
jgi:hypothetical protein